MKKQPAKTQPAQAVKQPSITFWEQLEAFFERTERWWRWGLPLLAFVLGLFLFDAKISLGGDDSSYVKRALEFLQEGTFPYYQGPGYPMVLALIIAIGGYNLIVLKFFSGIFYAFSILLTWNTFKQKIPYTVLTFVALFSATSSFFLYYSSQTWTEAFYMFVQAAAIWITVKVAESQTETAFVDTLKKQGVLWLLFGIILYYVTLTKSVAIILIAAPILYFALHKQWQKLILTIVSFGIFKVGGDALISALYGPNTSGQLQQMLMVDGYKPQLGYLNFDTGTERFFSNLKYFIGTHFYRIIGFLPVDYIKQAHGFVSFLTVGLMAAATWLSFKRNKFIFLLALICLVLCGGVFIGIHASNKQDRLILVSVPMALTVLGWFFYELTRKVTFGQYIVGLLLLAILGINVIRTTDKIPDSIAALQKNMAGERYYGYTPDWVNFFKMSEYCASKLPEGSKVLCRKGDMSFVATGKNMFPSVYTVDPKDDADAYLKRYKSQGATHMMIASLRRNPKKNDGFTINTLHRIGAVIQQKYPQALELVYTEGTSEPAYLYKINYPAGI